MRRSFYLAAVAVASLAVVAASYATPPKAPSGCTTTAGIVLVPPTYGYGNSGMSALYIFSPSSHGLLIGLADPGLKYYKPVKTSSGTKWVKAAQSDVKTGANVRVSYKPGSGDGPLTALLLLINTPPAAHMASLEGTIASMRADKLTHSWILTFTQTRDWSAAAAQQQKTVTVNDVTSTTIWPDRGLATGDHLLVYGKQSGSGDPVTAKYISILPSTW